MSHPSNKDADEWDLQVRMKGQYTIGAKRAVSLHFERKAFRLGHPKETHSMSSVLKKRRKKMRKHKYKKLRQRQKFLRRKS